MSTGKNVVDLQAIIDNPGQTVEELQGQVRALAQSLNDLIHYIDHNLYDNIMRNMEFSMKNRL